MSGDANGHTEDRVRLIIFVRTVCTNERAKVVILNLLLITI